MVTDSAAPAPDRPNILVFFTDQQRHDTIAALGNRTLRTPNLDRLVREGLAFTSAFTPAPVCVPARACLHYGQYPGKTRCYGNAYPMPADRKSYVDLLANAGYDTIGIGKCHFTPDRLAKRGFARRLTQEEVPARVADDDYLQFLQRSPYKHVRDAHGVWGERVYAPQTSPLPVDHHPTQWVGNQMIQYIDERAAEDRPTPWFAFCSFIHPHPPYSPPAPWDTMYGADHVDDPHLPTDFTARQNRFIRMALHNYYFDPPVSPTLWRLMKARYYACVSFIDHQVGRVLAALEQTAQLDNTLIVFTSDHGDMLGDLGLIGKEDMYGPSVRVPLVVRPPRAAGAGQRVATAVSLVDISATLCAAAGVEPPAAFDGENLLTLARDRSGCSDRIVISQVHEGRRGLYLAANAQHKYMYSAADDRECLHDHVADPHEDDDLIDDPAYVAPRDRLKAALFKYLLETHQREALGPSGKNWARWPDEPWSPPRKRSRSNVPCPWAAELGIDADMAEHDC